MALKAAGSPRTRSGLCKSQGLTNNPNSKKASCSRLQRNATQVKHGGGTVPSIQTVPGETEGSLTDIPKSRQDPTNVSGYGRLNNSPPNMPVA